MRISKGISNVIAISRSDDPVAGDEERTTMQSSNSTSNELIATDLIQGMKQAMRRLAASVVVVTARYGDTRYAMAASIDPSLRQ
jgi:hypothetical protein